MAETETGKRLLRDPQAVLGDFTFTRTEELAVLVEAIETEAREQGYTDGRDDGFYDGKDAGYDEGREAGYDAGWEAHIEEYG